ncbi:hypothetical protein FOA52_012111 [Chlamydomonas sp. UWO 241]|nr:hypothetical protein FOA52_012111 [Chlamydomonas sp. UWO 241]
MDCGASVSDAPRIELLEILKTRPADHISCRAINLEWLVCSFLDAHPDVEAKQMPTELVVKEIIKPETATQQFRYMDRMRAAGGADAAAVSAGRPMYYISHGWARPFMELVAMLTKHFSAEAQSVWRHGQVVLQPCEVFIWIDIFAMNQHCNLEGELQQLKEVIADAESTLMVVDQAGAVLTRIWCLYEAWQAGRNGPGRLALLSYGTDFESLRKVFIELDVSRAKATVQSDLEHILAEIAADIGVLRMSHDLKDALLASVLNEVPVGEGIPGNVAACDVMAKGGLMCQLHGRPVESELLYRHELAGRERVLGMEHPDTLNSVSNLANALQFQGKLVEAGPLYQRALAGSEKVLGAEHPITLSSVNNLATLLRAQSKLHEAGPLYQRALEGREKVLGVEHPDTLTSVSNLASLLRAQGKLGEAGLLYQHALAGRKKVLGVEHPDTLCSISNLASLLQAQSKLGEAEPLFLRALEGGEKVLGVEHPITLSSVNNLAALLFAQGEYSKAAPLFLRALMGGEKVLGMEHPDTLTSVSNLACLLQAQGKLGEVEPLFRRALAGKEKVLGAEHHDTRICVINMASLLID